MEIYRRIKSRRSGKTLDVLEMAEALLSIGRKVVIIVSDDRAVAYLKQTHRSILMNKDYIGYLILGASTNLNFMRGHRCDCIIVDDFDRCKNQTDIIAMAQIVGASLYSTES